MSAVVPSSDTDAVAIDETSETASQATTGTESGPVEATTQEPMIDSPSKPPFDHKRYVIRVQGNREYLPVAARLIWFRRDNPRWGIVTTPIEINLHPDNNRPPYAIFSASIFDEAGKVIATATKFEDRQGFPDFLEKAETGAVGRALAYCGYGTQFAPELEEGERLADAPFNRGNGDQRQNQRNQGNNGNGNARSAPPSRTMHPQDIPDSPPCEVTGCRNRLTRGQASMSAGKFEGHLYCPTHQKDATAGTLPEHAGEAPESQEERAPAAPAPPVGESEGEIEARRQALSAFSQEAYSIGFDVTTVDPQGQTVYSASKIGALVVEATATKAPTSFNNWLPPLMTIRLATQRLPDVKAKRDKAKSTKNQPTAAATTGTGRNVKRNTAPTPPADEDFADLSDPFAD